MAKRGREVNEVVPSNGLSIKIIEAEISKNKKMYNKLPDNLKRLPPPAQSTDLWFDFGKQWHPVGLFDVNDKLVISKNLLTMEISIISQEKETAKQAPYSVSAVATKGVYWFAVISVFVAGTISYKFSSSGACSLLHQTEIIEDETSYGAKVRAESSNAHVSKKPTTPSSTKDSQKKESSDNSKETDKKDSHLKKSKNPVLSKQDDSKVQRVAGNDALSSASFPSLSNRLNGIGKPGSPVPGGGPKLSYKNRIERIVSKSDSNIDSKIFAQSLVRVKGPILEIFLPPSLAIAILDDRARVDSGLGGMPSLVCSSMSTEIDCFDSGRSQPTIQLTVSDLLSKIQLRAKHSIAECDVLILRFRQLFECLFETSILYSTERAVMKNDIAAIKAQKSSFADNYGGIYLLRLLILIVTGTDSLHPKAIDTNNSNNRAGEVHGSDSLEIVNENTSSSDKSYLANSSLHDELVLVPDTTHNISKSSKLRRSAIIDKHQKNEFYKFQELVDLALKELDESAHIIF